MGKTITVHVQGPEEISEQAKAAAQSRAEEAVVLAFWEAGEISTRVAAEELGLTYRDFLDLLAARGIPVERRPPNENAIDQATQNLAAKRP